MNLDRLKGLSVAVLLGGNSPERDISLRSGATIVQALAELGALPRPLDPAEPAWLRELEGAGLVFIALHGTGGEDGLMQGALATLQLPYTGSAVLGSALAMDKISSKRVWRALGIPTADFEELSAESDWQALSERLGPVFVKPANGGSSIATARADDAGALAAAWRDAARYDARVVAERLIVGPEYSVSILGQAALPAVGMETDNSFYDYEAKYLSAATRYHCPCELPAAAAAQLAELALRAFAALQCSVWGRVDFMRDRAGTFYVLEVNTVPGMTDHSLVPIAARAAGMELPELVGRIACLSLAER